MRLSDEELEMLFREFDKDLNGYLDEKELRRLLRKLGREASRSEIREILAQADLNDDKQLDFMEFQQLMNSANILLQHEVPGKAIALHVNATTETWFKTFIAGGVAGVVSRTVVSPLERLKILFQTQPHIPGKQVKYTSMTSALATIYREEGWKGFFKGNATNCVRIFPSTAIQFSAYEGYKELANKLWLPLVVRQELMPWERVVAGGMAGITALLMYPLEFVRARLTVQTTGQYKGMWDCMTQVSRKEGPLALFRGLCPSGVVPYAGIDFAVYDVLKHTLPKKPDGSMAVQYTLTAGAVAGTLAQTVAYPLDLVRRRLQVQDMMPDAERYWGMTDAFQRIWRREGIVGFYRGLVPNYAKVIPSISLSFAVYEELKRGFKLPGAKV